MIAKVVKAFFDQEAGTERLPGSSFEVDAKRFEAVNAAFPGTLEREQQKRATRKKAVEEK